MIKKLFKFYKENKWIIITFFISMFTIFSIYILKRIAPFGNNSMLDVDFYHQYGPLLNELYDRVSSGENLLYSFNTGGGIPFYRNFLNYLSSPFNIIMFLFKKENIVMSFSLIIALKVIFSSTTMSYYLKKSFKKDGFMICIFGLLYAFSGYFCAYYWNIMWLDGMVFLPLIAYGINRIIDYKKPVFYTISLSIMLFANYFIGYMICIFSVFYFLAYFIYRGNYKLKNILHTFLIFFIFSLISAGLVSFALLPLFDSLKSISATSDSFPIISTNFSLSDYLFNHISSSNRTVFASDILPVPNVYSGLITLLLIICLFINKKINTKFKVLSILSIIFFYLSFNINTFDFIWHAFHVPNDLPYRYSFLYVFVLIIIAYYSFININSLSKIKTSICFMLLFVFVMLASKFGFENLDDVRIIVCLVLIVIYYILYLLSFIKKIPKVLISSLLILTISFECIYSINVNWSIDHDIDTFMEDKKYYSSLINYKNNIDNDFNRMEKTSYLTLNDGAWYDYKGISTFSSMAYESTSKVQRKLGMAGNNINSYYYKNYQSPVYNTMFNIKYIMGDYIDDDYYTNIYSNDYNLNMYNYSSSLIYMVNKDVKNISLEEYEPFMNQEEFVYLSTGYKNIYDSINVSKVSNEVINYDNYSKDFYYDLNGVLQSLTITLDNKVDQSIYLYIKGDNISSFEVDNEYYGITSDEYYIVNIGKKLKGLIDIKINFSESTSGNLKLYAYCVNDSVFKEFYQKIKEGSLETIKYSDSLIEGKITAKENQIAFTSISYDKGWSVYVDDKKVKTYKVLDTYLGFNVRAGRHKIKLVFYPSLMKEGLIISFISFVLLVSYIIFNNFYKTKNKKKDEFIV